MKTEMRPGVNWVGCVDWTVRDFHGYRTERGTTYNAYLVEGQRDTALIDTVKAPFAEELLRKVQARVPLDRIRYVVCNHAEPDHSGALPRVMEACRSAQLLCNARCRDALGRHYDTAGWNFRVVTEKEPVDLGGRTLTFMDTPMVHWPESMFTYVPEERVLFSMDAFGQHYASGCRFDSEEPLEVVMDEAKKYFANIVMLYGRPIANVLERASGLALETIAPSHGIIWHAQVGRILEAYQRWVVQKPAAKIMVVYDTMWKSTELMAQAILEGALERGVDVQLHHARTTERTLLATEFLDSAAVAFGSATLNLTLMPDMAAVLTYLKGLKPSGKAGFAFGSYGWAGGGARDVNGYMEAMKLKILREPLQAQFVPRPEDLQACREAGRMLGDYALKATGEPGA